MEKWNENVNASALCGQGNCGKPRWSQKAIYKPNRDVDFN